MEQIPYAMLWSHRFPLQIGHLYKLQKEYGLAKETYERVLEENSNHAKALQQMGWLYHLQACVVCRAGSPLCLLRQAHPSALSAGLAPLSSTPGPG